MHRRKFLKTSLVASVGAASLPIPGIASQSKTSRRATDTEEVSISEWERRMVAGRESAVSITRKYLARIDELDRRGPTLNSVIELNPDALTIAAELDNERKRGTIRSPLHGIPLLIKDNIDSHDRMATTAGSLALAGSIAPQDAFLVEKLRQAGAILLGKTNLSEWANFRGSHSTSGWSGRGGQTRNPYVLDRNPSGSSSGSGAAVSANLCAAAVGTETDGSVTSPSAFNGIVGMKPTLGLISRSGVIPIAHSQDTAGPMARTVTDAAILLGAMAGTDPSDAATAEADAHKEADYVRFLRSDALRGARIGVAREFGGYHLEVDKVFDQALYALKCAGAELIDPVDLKRNSDMEGAELEVLRYEMKADMNAYLAKRGPDCPIHTLEDIIRFNEKNADKELKWFGQEELIKSQGKGPLTDSDYVKALEKCRRLSRAEGIDRVMNAARLDAIVAPTTGPAHVTDWVNGDHGLGDCTTPAAVAGYPHITVPAGFVQELPVGISFFGRAWSEGKLISFAYAFEQATHARKAPGFLVTIKG